MDDASTVWNMFAMSGQPHPTTYLVLSEARPEKVGRRIAALREAMAMSKAQFADALGYDRSSQTKLEAGGKKLLQIDTAMKICAMTGVGLDYIYRGDLSDVPEKIRPKVLIELATGSTTDATRDTR